MKRVAFTFLGKDRPGIIARVTRILYENGSNIEDGTMTILEGQFAMILIATTPTASTEKTLRTEFKRLRRSLGLNHFWEPLKGKRPQAMKYRSGIRSYLITVIGRDRTGIVYEASRILAENKLNITNLNSQILGRGAKQIFAMMLEVDVPPKFPWKKVDAEWRKLRERLGVEISVRPMEHLNG